MKTSNSVSSIIKQGSFVAVVALGLAACGTAADKSNKKSVNDGNANVQAQHGSGLALQLPGTIPSAVDQVKVTLTEEVMLIGAPCFFDLKTQKSDCPKQPTPWTKTYTFSTKDKALAINDLAPKGYAISVDLLDSKTGKVYEHGEGFVTIQSDRTAQAHVSLTNVSGDNGNLVITLGDKPAPGTFECCIDHSGTIACPAVLVQEKPATSKESLGAGAGSIK